MSGMLVVSPNPKMFGCCGSCGVEFSTEEDVNAAHSIGQVYSIPESDGFTYEIVYYHRCGAIPPPSNIVQTDGFDY